jgi:hypothetical protein
MWDEKESRNGITENTTCYAREFDCVVNIQYSLTKNTWLSSGRKVFSNVLCKT